MKQTEISKLKKQFNIGNERLTVNKFAIAVIEQKKLKQFKVKSFSTMEDTEQIVYMKLLKESLGGKVGKALLEYKIPATNFSNNSGVQQLYELNQEYLSNEDNIRTVMVNLVGKSLYDMPVCITVADIEYNVPSNKQNEADDEFDEDNIFHFTICSIIPLTFAEAELYFNESRQELIGRKEKDGSLVLANKVTDAIVYPVLNDGAKDVNYVLYRTKDPKTPNQSIVEEFLQCNYTMSGIDEGERGKAALYATFGTEMDYDTLRGIKTELKRIESENAENPEIARVSSGDLAESLRNLDWDEDTVCRFEKKYNETVGEGVEIKTVNALNTEKTVLKTSGITITAKQSVLDKISIKEMGGHRCIVIEADETLKMDDMILGENNE